VPKTGAAARRSPLIWLLFGLKGRISRPIYWAALAAVYCVNMAMYLELTSMTEEDFDTVLPLILLLGGAATLYVNIAVAVKRLHDIGRRGMFAVAIMVPFLNVVVTVWAGLQPGTPGPNPFGDLADAPPA
jgi:uncharacterized membrane protein YhaH (DUF805 family)